MSEPIKYSSGTRRDHRVDEERTGAAGALAREGRSALGNGDLALLRESAHKLYGTLAAFSTVAGALALTLEDSATGGDVDSCRELVDQLEAVCAELVDDTQRLTIDALRQSLKQ